MGRELKRVPLNFDWPIDKVWEGYLSCSFEDGDDYQTEPPVGDGYQMWETISESSPISPVFATPDELANWLAEHNRGIDVGTTAKQWLAFINGPGWAPSMVMDAKGLRAGVQASVDGDT